MVKLTVVADEVPAGGKLAVRDKVGNAGKAAAKASVVGYYLSTDEFKSKDDILMGSRKVSALKAGKARSGSVSLTVPNAVGLFRVIACADDKKRVKESHEANNCRAIARDIRITSGTPQARIRSSTASRFCSMSSGETSDSRFRRSSGSVFDGRTLKCQSS
jgi:hypothetical protein